MQSVSGPVLGPTTVSQGACVSCKAKKLKCDRLPRSCHNCTRLGEQCINVDPRSGEMHTRDYVDGLWDEAERLRRILNDARNAELGSSLDHTSPSISRSSHHYGGSGSIFSLGQLVAAAVSRGSENSFLRLGVSLLQERQKVEKVSLTELPLPSLGDAVELAKSYFNALHVTMPFMRQKDVFGKLERLYTENPPYTGQEKTRDLFQLHMIFAIGGMRSPERWKKGFARDHYVTAMGKENLLSEVDPISETQNLLLVFVFATLHNVGIASTWEIIRQAMRVCVKYGFHTKATAEDDICREQLRRRVFWSAYISDRHCSQNLGRPVVLAEDEIDIEVPMNQDHERMERGEPEIPGQYTEVTNLIRHTLLRRLGTKARIALNSLSQQGASSAELTQTANTWIDALESWYTSSVVKPTPTNAYETKEYLDINFHRERMKFLSYIVLPSKIRQVPARDEHLWQYTVSANQILLAYQKQANDGFLAPNWTYVQDVLKSGFGILYCAVVKNDRNVGLVQSELEMIVGALKLCGETLNSITRQWETVRRHAQAFMQMSEAVIELVSSTARHGPRAPIQIETPIATASELGDLTNWNSEAVDDTLDVFHGESAPFTDEEWAELFELAPSSE